MDQSLIAVIPQARVELDEWRNCTAAAADICGSLLARIKTLDPLLHAFNTVTGDEAMARAEAIDRDLDDWRDKPLVGVPIALNQRAAPFSTHQRQPLDLSVYAQDKWTLKRLTLTPGVRFDYMSSGFRDFHLGPVLYIPNRDITFRGQPLLAVGPHRVE